MAKDPVKINENAADIQSLVINMYKEGFMDGYLRCKGMRAKDLSAQEKNEMWDKIKDQAKKDFDKFIKVKGGKNKKKNG